MPKKLGMHAKPFLSESAWSQCPKRLGMHAKPNCFFACQAKCQAKCMQSRSLGAPSEHVKASPNQVPTEGHTSRPTHETDSMDNPATQHVLADLLPLDLLLTPSRASKKTTSIYRFSPCLSLPRRRQCGTLETERANTLRLVDTGQMDIENDQRLQPRPATGKLARTGQTTKQTG